MLKYTIGEELFTYKVDAKGNVSIEMKDTSSDTIQVILRTMITQLETIEASYKKYVKIINK